MKTLKILHFNDVYNIDGEPGVAKFKTAFDHYNSSEALVIFSGDLFFPSFLSTVYDGK